jgi:hypothetical protein
MPYKEQRMMIFDLLFIFVVLASAAALVFAAVSALLARRQRALTVLGGYAVGIVIYLGVVAFVGLISPQRIFAVGEDRCFDDWCVAVADVTAVTELGEGADRVRANGQFYVVTLRLSNHARGRSQRVSSAAVHLIDDKEQLFEVSQSGQAAFEAQNGPALPLTSLLEVGQSINTVRVFDIPADSHHVGLTIVHPVGPAPGLFIIGDDASLFHKPAIILLN